MRKCIVLINRIEAGILTEIDSPREYRFEYYKEYLDKGLPGVCLAMPPRREPYRSPVLFPYFFNMLSEGANRALQSSYHHIPKEDDFGILLATALYDTPGIVTVSPIDN